MTINYKVFSGNNIDFLKPLVNQLMVFQAQHATIRPDIMGSMNYDNRMKSEYKGSKNEHLLIAYADEKPVGFAYGTIAEVTETDVTTTPDWAKTLQGMGFYPDNYDVPKTVGIFKLLFVDENYRGFNIGKKLSDNLMTWLREQPVKDLWVYVANGNEKVARFYANYGFNFSHEVYDGFITAYKQTH